MDIWEYERLIYGHRKNLTLLAQTTIPLTYYALDLDKFRRVIAWGNPIVRRPRRSTLAHSYDIAQVANHFATQLPPIAITSGIMGFGITKFLIIRCVVLYYRQSARR